MNFQIRIQINWLITLLIANTVLFLLANLLINLVGSGSTQYETVGLLGGYDFFKVYSGQLWLLITSGFLHFQIFHFLLNMYSLYRVGQIIVQYYNEKLLFSVFILGVLGGSLFTFIASILEYMISGNISSPLSVGASGGIFALIGLLLGATLRKTRFGYGVPFNFMEILPVVVFSLAIGFLPGTNINNFAHIGGLVTGIICGLLFIHSGSIKTKSMQLIEENVFRFLLLLTTVSFFALIFNFAVKIFG